MTWTKAKNPRDTTEGMRRWRLLQQFTDAELLQELADRKHTRQGHSTPHELPE